MSDDTGAPRAVPRDRTLGELIRSRRRELGLTQAQLANIFNIDQSRVSRWELGERVDAKKISLLADWLDLSPAEVLQLNYLESVVHGDDDQPTEISTITVDSLPAIQDMLGAAFLLDLGVRLSNHYVGGVMFWELTLLNGVPE